VHSLQSANPAPRIAPVLRAQGLRAGRARAGPTALDTAIIRRARAFSTRRGFDADEYAKRIAAAAGLRYVSDSEPGLTRAHRRGKFVYFYPDGRRVSNPAEIKRINALAIPPAYQDVWISRNPDAHIQATGRDAKGRKQYRYHAQWRTIRDAAKFERLLEFGQVLPRIRRRVARLLRLDGMPREKVLAAVLQLLEVTLIRIGNDEYARHNGSYGLTTLCTRHVEVSGSTVNFDFRGKSGKEHKVEIKHPGLAKIVKRCMQLPGRELFQYLDEDGQRHAVTSTDVNQLLQQIAGSDFTAKDYRTWAASVLALDELAKLPVASERDAKRHILAAACAVAERLGNTPAICRKSYIHPALLETYRTGKLSVPRMRRSRSLRTDEAAFLGFLRELRGRAAAVA